MADTAATNGGSAMGNLKGSKCFKLAPALPAPRTDDEHATIQQQRPTAYQDVHAQAAYDQLASGPAAQSVKNQSAKTGSELSNLAASRQTPLNPAATGQPLTHYHSFFSELLSWNNPRASAIAYTSIVTVIFLARYLDVIRYTFKLTWMALGVTVLAEVAGKAILSQGLTTQLRPRKYFTVPRETLDAVIGDVHELINFFVIEAQRIFFAENVLASSVAAVGAFLAYYLAKVVPYWGLGIMATTLLFFVPLIYTTNQELIDNHLKQASDIVNSQTEQLRQVAGKHTAQAAEMTKQYMGDYTHKAQEMIRGRSASPTASKKPATTGPQENDFPQVPTQGFSGAAHESVTPEIREPEIKAEEEPLLA